MTCTNVGGIWQKEVPAGWLLVVGVVFLVIAHIVYALKRSRLEASIVHANLNVQSVVPWNSKKAVYLIVESVSWLKENRIVSIIATNSNCEVEQCIARGLVDHQIASGKWQIQVVDEEGCADEVVKIGYKLLSVRPYIDQ